MASPSVRSSIKTDGSTATATPAISLPATIRAGDVLFVFFRVAVAGAIGWPAGWTELFDESTDAADDQEAAAWRKADGTEGATITLSCSSGKFAAVAYAVQDTADPINRPPELSTIATGTSAGQPNATTVTPTGGSKDYLFLTFYGMEGEETGVTTYPTGYTGSQLFANSGTAGVVTTNVTIGSATKAATAASDDAGAWVVGGTIDDWSAYTIAFHPGDVIPDLLTRAQLTPPPRRPVLLAVTDIAVLPGIAAAAPPADVLPFTNTTWPIARARAVGVSSIDVLPGIAVVVTPDVLPVANTWAAPRYPKRRIYDEGSVLVVESAVAVAPFTLNTWPTPRPPLRRMPKLAGQAVLPTDPRPLTVTDWPTPRRLRVALGESAPRPAVLDLVVTADALPFANTWPTGARRRALPSGLTDAVPPVPDPLPATTTWPSPLRTRARVADLGARSPVLDLVVAPDVLPVTNTWAPLRPLVRSLTPLAPAVLPTDPLPLTVTDWPAPRRARPVPAELGLRAPLVYPTDPLPFANTSTTLRRVAAKGADLGATVLATDPLPLAVTAWPSPRPLRAVPATLGARAAVLDLVVTPDVLPFTNTWAPPRRTPPEPVELGARVPQFYRIDPLPFSVTEWPQQRRPKVIASPIGTRPTVLDVVVTPDVLPFTNTWPSPLRARLVITKDDPALVSLVVADGLPFANTWGPPRRVPAAVAPLGTRATVTNIIPPDVFPPLRAEWPQPRRRTASIMWASPNLLLSTLAIAPPVVRPFTATDWTLPSRRPRTRTDAIPRATLVLDGIQGFAPPFVSYSWPQAAPTKRTPGRFTWVPTPLVMTPTTLYRLVLIMKL